MVSEGRTYVPVDSSCLHLPHQPNPQAIFALAMTITIPILAPALAFVILIEPRSHPLHQIAAVGLVAVNLMWFFKFMTKYLAAAASSHPATAKAAAAAVAGCSPRKASTMAA